MKDPGAHRDANPPTTGSAPLTGLRLALVVVAAFIWPASTALGATFTLQNGTSIEGEILYASTSAVVIRTSSGALEQLSRRVIDRVAIRTRKNGTLTGALVSWAGGVYEIETGQKVFRVQQQQVLPDRRIAAKKTVAADEKTATERQIRPEPSAAAKLQDADARQDTGSKPTAAKIIVTAAQEREDSGIMVFKLGLSESVKKSVLLIYATAEGTARADEDYKALRGAVILRPGAASATVDVPLVDDKLAEGEETFELLVTSDLNLDRVEVERASATILDDEAPGAD